MKKFNKSETKKLINLFNNTLKEKNLNLNNNEIKEITYYKNNNEIIINLKINNNIIDSFIYNIKLKNFYSKTYILNKNGEVAETLGGVGKVYEDALTVFIKNVISLIK